MPIRYERANDLQGQINEIATGLFPYVKLDSVICLRSFGSTSRFTIARCHALGKAMQLALGRRGFYVIEVEKCHSLFSQARGLMFKKKSESLLFIFKNKKRRAIHSFFCIPFIAIWFDEKKVIEIKRVKSWRFSIKPKHKFNKLLEIPSNDTLFKEFIDEEKI